MVLRKKIRIGLALKGVRTPRQWKEAFHSDKDIELFELSCFFGEEIINIFENLEGIKKLKKSSKIKISLHCPPVINIKSGEEQFIFNHAIKCISILSKELDAE